MIARQAQEAVDNGSTTRRMFEEGARLKKIHGADRVFDFSLGNPDLEPPEAVTAALRETAADPAPGSHHYMSNAGYPETRAACARREQRRAGWQEEIPAESVTMTVGAASALTCSFFALLDPGDEVIILKPYFSEYFNYLKLRGAVGVAVDTEAETFQPLADKIAAAVTKRTKAVLINSPNNPSGAVYTESKLQDLARSLKDAEAITGRPIYIISDEPYVEIVYDGLPVPSLLNIHPHTLICYSWSKSFALPGERIGYVLVSPRSADYEALCQAIPLGLRILGFVNAPAIWQRVIAKTADAAIEVSEYGVRRDLLMEILHSCGFDCPKPEGAFYLLLPVPDGDDERFAARCAEENILVVPAAGFGAPGYVRIAYCVDRQVIERSAAGFRKVAEIYNIAN